MPTFLFDFGALQVKVRYLWQKGKDKPYYYRRRYPQDIADILFNRGKEVGTFHTVALRTRDLQRAAKWVTQINRKVEEEWHQLRQGLAVDTTRKAAEQLLADYGLEAMAMEEQRDNCEAEDHFIEQLSRKVPEDAHPSEALADFEYSALQILKGEYQHRLSDAQEHYLSTREKTRKRSNEVARSFAMVMEILGDRPLVDYRRREVADVIRQVLDAGLKTSTVKKQMGLVRTAVKELIRDYELSGVSNAFAEFKIPKYGEDVDKRESLTSEQVERVREYVRRDDHKDNTSADILGLLVDTGTRLSEVVGLRCEDVILDADVPHIHIRPNSLRRLKNKSSVRIVPLVGDSLFSAQRAMARATDSPYLFPKYMKKAKIKNDAASATLRKLMKKRDCLTPHCLRHTMTTRLRNANIPKPRVDELQGWNDGSMANYYGSGTALKLLQADLLKTL